MNIPAIRLHCQQLAKPMFTDAQSVVKWMGAMQAQQPSMAKLALAMRIRGGNLQQVEQAIDQGRVLRTHVMRPTWHYVAPDDVRWMLALSHDRLKAAYASLVKTHGIGITERMYDEFNLQLHDMLTGGRSLTKRQIADRLVGTGIHTENVFLTRFLENAENEALICSGHNTGKEHTYMLLDERVAPAPQPSKEAALAMLARNYFRSHAPATVDDFCWWSGLSLKEARLAAELIANELHKVPFGNRIYMIHEVCNTKVRIPLPVIFLPSYDEYIISYKYRSDVIAPDQAHKAFTNNGIFFPVILQKGRVTGNWKASSRGNKTDIIATYFENDTAESTATANENARLHFRKFYST